MKMEQRSVAVRGIDMAYAEWGGEHATTVLLAHATGFHGRCWDGVVRELGDGVRVLAPDLRGHGRTSKRGPYDWREFGADVTAFVEALELTGLVAAGHSMGGHSIVQAAGRQPERFRKLLLVDPVIMDPDQYASGATPRPEPARVRRPANPDHPSSSPAVKPNSRNPRFTAASAAGHPVARRRNAWASAEAMFARFEDRQPFSLWRRDVLMDYCRHGLVADGDGFVLACPPSVEASIYMGSAGRDISDIIATLPHPTVVLRGRRKSERDGEMDFTQSPTWPGLAAALPNGRDVYLPELTHFIPMQRPDLVAAHIRELL